VGEYLISVVAEYVFLANKTPPKFILFVVPADKLILVPIIILLGPIDDKTLALPTLKPINVELFADVVYNQQKPQRNLSYLRLMLDNQSLNPRNLSFLRLLRHYQHFDQEI
jgi:hypothetical protein